MAGGRRSHGQGTFWGDLIGLPTEASLDDLGIL